MIVVDFEAHVPVAIFNVLVVAAVGVLNVIVLVAVLDALVAVDIHVAVCVVEVLHMFVELRLQIPFLLLWQWCLL